SDPRLVDRFPRAPRPHERLVVKSGGDKRREHVVQGAEVEGEARPAVLTVSLESLVNLNLGGAQIGRIARVVTTNRNQRVGLLRAGGKYAAWAVILEGSTDEVHAVA